MFNNSGSQYEAQLIELMKEYGVESDDLKDKLCSASQDVGIDQIRAGFSALQAAGKLGSVTPDLGDFENFLKPVKCNQGLGGAFDALGVNCSVPGGFVKEAESDRPTGCGNGNLGTMVESDCGNGSLGTRL